MDWYKPRNGTAMMQLSDGNIQCLWRLDDNLVLESILPYEDLVAVFGVVGV